MTQDERNDLLEINKACLLDRAQFDAHYRELGDHILPRRTRFTLTDVNKGNKRNDKIINSTATTASRVLSAGMHAGITSPARPWARMAVNDPKLSDRSNVKSYLHEVMQGMFQVMAKSNFYNGFAQIYQDIGVFATGATWIDEDKDDVIRVYSLPVGEYVLFTDHRNVVVGIQRRLMFNVRQMVAGFGRDNVSRTVRAAYDRSTYGSMHEVLHTVQPRKNRDPRKVDSKNMPWESSWIELNADSDKPSLVESGYRVFPVLAPRWAVTGMDVYGTMCPGMEALGDIKALQALERSKGKIVAKLDAPPMKGPASLRNQRSSLLPGDMTYLDGAANGHTFEPALKLDPNSVHVTGEEIMRHEGRIKEAFMADLWLMMAQSDRRQITAREVDERHEEKMLQLGPVLERLQDELLDPAIERVFDIMSRRGLLPTTPRELIGQEIKIEYISILMQAQKLLSTSGVERLVTFAMNTGNVRPDILDNINFDETIKHYADTLGVKPDLINGEDVVAQIRQQRAEAQAREQQMKQVETASRATAQLGRADVGGGQTALAALMNNAGGGPLGSALTGMPPGGGAP